MHHLKILMLALWGVLSWAHAQPTEPQAVSVELAAFVVSEQVGDDGTVTEAFTEAETVFAGQVIEYRLTATNRSGAVLPGGRLTLVGPVPVQTRYLPDSASATGPDGRLEASLDGDTFGEPPLLVTATDADGREVEVEADPGDYRALRWVVLRALQPDETIVLHYRVVVR